VPQCRTEQRCAKKETTTTLQRKEGEKQRDLLSNTATRLVRHIVGQTLSVQLVRALQSEIDNAFSKSYHAFKVKNTLSMFCRLMTLVLLVCATWSPLIAAQFLPSPKVVRVEAFGSEPNSQGT
jgi:hypothetical protein